MTYKFIEYKENMKDIKSEENEFCIPEINHKKNKFLEDKILAENNIKLKRIKKEEEFKRNNHSINAKVGPFKSSFIIKYLLIMYLLNPITSKNLLIFNKVYLSKINLKIKGTFYSEIYNSSFTPKPDDIYINRIQQIDKKSGYYFNETENDIELIWNTKLTLCNSMFYGCSNISEIDLPYWINYLNLIIFLSSKHLF